MGKELRLCVGPFPPNQLLIMFSLTERGIAFPCTVNGFILKIITKPWLYYQIAWTSFSTKLATSQRSSAWNLQLWFKFRDLIDNCIMKLKFVANFRNRPSNVLSNALYSNFISNLVLYTTPELICFEFLSCFNKGLNDGWRLRVTHSWHILEVSAAKLISQAWNKTTFRHFPQKL